VDSCVFPLPTMPNEHVSFLAALRFAPHISGESCAAEWSQLWEKRLLNQEENRD
jgi:hypothetical protein